LNQKIRYASSNNTGEGKPTFNDRFLHKLLESKQDFSHWISNRIWDYGFVEGTDFTTILSKSPISRPSKEYDLTIPMAKELSMVERNDKGRMARHYFI
jgi:anti-repressor protein